MPATPHCFFGADTKEARDRRANAGRPDEMSHSTDAIRRSGRVMRLKLTVVLPQVLAYNARFAPDAMNRIARALGTDNAAEGVYELARANGAPVALRDLGMPENEPDRAAEIAVASPYWNPRPVDRSGLRDLLQGAFEGARPGAATR
jgi:Iron-containing alcohol dehydrogenase